MNRRAFIKTIDGTYTSAPEGIITLRCSEPVSPGDALTINEDGTVRKLVPGELNYATAVATSTMTPNGYVVKCCVHWLYGRRTDDC